MMRFIFASISLLLASFAGAQTPPPNTKGLDIRKARVWPAWDDKKQAYTPTNPLVIATEDRVAGAKPLEPAFSREGKLLPAAAIGYDRLLWYHYDAASKVSVGIKKPLVTFVGIKGRTVPGTVTCAVDTLEGYKPGSIVVSVSDGGWLSEKATLNSTATNGQIAAVVRGQAVQPAANPFQPAGPDASGPGLAVSEQTKLKALWPEGVPWIDGLVFYSDLKARQGPATLYSPSGPAQKRFFRFPRGDFPWDTPGGMHWTPRTAWRNATGIRIPAGSVVDVWWENKPVPEASRHLPVMQYALPSGTVTVDMLIRKMNDGTEKTFELRVREKGDSGWDDGTAYRPTALEDGTPVHYDWASPKLQERTGVVSAEYRAKRVSLLTLPFRATRAVTVDGRLTPPGYIGPGMRCAACHDRAGAVVSYGGTNPGSDTTISWLPLRPESIGDTEEAVVTPVLDYRWPIRLLQAR